MVRRYKFTVAAVVLVFASAALAQTEATFVYVESFRKGSTRVKESATEIVLDTHNPTCRIHVKDEHGADRYELGCIPQTAAANDPRITSWQVRLADLHHKIYANVLMPTADSSEDKAQIGWLDPGKFAKIPITRERVVKVDSFYCDFQVMDYRFVNLEQPYLDRVTLAIRFTNSMPHMQVVPKEEKTGA